MGISSVQFSSNGKLTEHRNPGSFSDNIYDSGSSGSVAAGNAVIIGDSIGGEPFTLYCFSSDGQASEILKSGSLRDGVRMAFNPGGGYKPQKIYAMSVNTKTKASLEHDNIIFKSLNYGVQGNNLKLSFTNNDDEKSFNVCLKNKLETLLNVENKKSVFLTLTTTEDNWQVTVNKTSLTLTKTDPAVSRVFDFETYETVEELIEVINESNNEQGTVIATASTELKSTDLSCELDSVSTSLTNGTVFELTANVKQLFKLLENTGFIEVDCSKMTDFVLPSSLLMTSFTGGENGECTVLEYAKALELLKKENIQLISTTSEEEAVHLLIKEHCEECNARTGKRERQAIVGGGLNETLSRIKERANQLGSEFVSLCSPGFYDYDYNDPLRKKMKFYSSAFYACKMLGQQASMEVGEPSTKKEVSHFGWEVDYNDSEIDFLIENGVWVGEKETDEFGTTRYQTARSITTTKEDNILLVEFSVIREELYMARDLRACLNSGSIGVKGLDSLTASMETKVRQRLDDYKNRGLLRTWDANSVSISVNSDVTKIEWSGCPAIPNNFNFITNKYTVYRSSSET